MSSAYLEAEEMIFTGDVQWDADFLKRFTVIASSQAKQDVVNYANDYVEKVAKAVPYAMLVVGESSKVEKTAAVTAQMLGLRCQVITKAEKGEWDEGADIRDERVVSEVALVIALDDSARSKHYKQLAERSLRRYVRRKP